MAPTNGRRFGEPPFHTTRFTILMSEKRCSCVLNQQTCALVFRIVFVAENRWAFASDAFEHSGEMLRILESEVIGNNAHIIVGGEEPAFGFGYDSQCDYVLRGAAGLALDKIAEIARRQIRLFREI